MPRAGRTKRHVLPQRARTVLRIVGVGALLALVIMGVGVATNLLSDQGATPHPVATAPGQTQYDAGLSALASGDTTRAVELLQQSAAAGNTAAAAKLAELSKPAKPKPEPRPSVVASDAYAAAMPDLAVLLPTSLDGFDLSQAETAPASAIVSGQPNDDGPAGYVSLVAISVIDKKSAEGSAAWMARFNRAYSDDRSAVTVGDLSAQFGTDGAHLAAVAFVRGRYAFEIVATAVRGRPKQQKSVVVGVASSIAAAHTTP